MAVLLIVLLSISSVNCIKVDWGTRKGPIIPPTPSPPPPEPKVHRDPAPVWEDQSNDIPNPVTYR